MIVLFDVRWRATNISSPIATSESLTISTVKGSMSFAGATAIRSPGLRLDDQVAVLVHGQPLPREDDCRGRGLFDNGWPFELTAGAEPVALVDPRLAAAELVEVDV